MPRPYENLTEAQKQRLAMRKKALEDDDTDTFFKVQKKAPKPPEGWKEQGK